MLTLKRHAASALTIPALALGLAVVSAGCTSIQTRTPEGEAIRMSKNEFAAYVEHVFRHHNNVVNDLLYVPHNADIQGKHNGRELEGAEARMSNACLPLNELASNSAVGKSPNFWARMQLPDAVPACEAATRGVEKLMPPDLEK